VGRSATQPAGRARRGPRQTKDPRPSRAVGRSMSTPHPAGKISVASVSDRGLNPKRPLNEDSFLADAARGIFVVADGVGGAEAGEVASAAAIDILNQAFHEKLAAGEDAEDLMELAIQRANNSIHQLAVENPRLSSMAQT